MFLCFIFSAVDWHVFWSFYAAVKSLIFLIYIDHSNYSKVTIKKENFSYGEENIAINASLIPRWSTLLVSTYNCCFFPLHVIDCRKLWMLCNNDFLMTLWSLCIDAVNWISRVIHGINIGRWFHWSTNVGGFFR